MIFGGICLLATSTSVVAGPGIEPGASVMGNYLAGRFAESVRDLPAAADFLKAVLVSDPKVPDLLRRTFVILTMEGRFAEAVTLARQYVAEKPSATIGNLVLAVDEIKAGHYEAADQRLLKQPDTGLSGWTSPVLRAWALVATRKVDEALLALKPLQKEKSVYELHKGLVLEVGGRHQQAVDVLEKIVGEEGALSFRVVDILGNIYEQYGEKKKARALYDRYHKEYDGSTLFEPALKRLSSGGKPRAEVASAQDGSAEILFGIASSLRQQRSSETAMVLVRLALYLKPDYPIAQTLAGELLELDGRLSDANRFYARINPDSAFGRSATLRIAANLNDMKKTDEAIALLRKLATKYPDDPEAPTRIGDYLRSQERFREAVPEYDEAVRRVGELKPQHWRLLYIRGIVLEREKQWEKAEKDLLKALEFQPDQPYVLNYLGYSWVEQRVHLDRALAMIRKAVKLRPHDGYIIDSLGWGYYQLAKFDDAVAELERAVEYRPEDPVINDHLGDAYWSVGRKLEARFQWKRSLSLSPDEQLKKTVMEKLKHGLNRGDAAGPAKNKKVPDNG